ncbi:MAG: hypothetical protein EZS28_043635 [Streblomastix strix]|uniref:RRM domain-containing protein n=1 Tax=Streblomastix strix TaxID=222440 RepID=A0A5J4TRH8_9EUKA|nr:MAG: hypothetical protein EZS28_043635 [Streblomastix strix]
MMMLHTIILKIMHGSTEVILSIEVFRDYNNPYKSLGYGCLNFSRQEHADKALELLNYQTVRVKNNSLSTQPLSTQLKQWINSPAKGKYGYVQYESKEDVGIIYNQMF